MSTGSTKPVTKTEAAFISLRTAIEQGSIKPGARLRVNDLIDSLGMSPTPIREALRLLQAEGLLEHEPHRGMVVAAVSTDLVDEVYRLRLALEPLAAELAADQITDEELAQLVAIHEQIRHAIDDGRQRTELARLNERWHWTIYRAARSRLMTEFITRLWATGSVKSFWRLRHEHDSFAQHEAVVKALQARDAAAAADALRAHIAFGAESRLEQLRELDRGD